MNTPEKILSALKKSASQKIKLSQAHFGISNVNSYGLTIPQMRAFAKQIGTNHELALQLWKTQVHEARHIASMIADPKLTTEKMMEQWLKDFNSWDIVDGCCSSLFLHERVDHAARRDP